MNGARSTFMRQGYWLTALAAIVLLAASPGTAQAQLVADEDHGEGGVKVDIAKTVAEGNSATISVSIKADVTAATILDARTVTVTITKAGVGAPPDTSEAEDAQFNPTGVLTFIFPANNDPDDSDTVTPDPVTHTITKSVSLQTTQDPDAEDENVVLMVAVDGGLTSAVVNKSIKIDDAETQTYVFKVTTDDPEEGMPIVVTLRADPAHVNDDLELTLHLDDPDYEVTDGLTEGTVTINAGTGQAGMPITVTPPNDDGNRAEDSVTLTAHSGSVGNSMRRASVVIDVADANELPAVEMMVVDKDGDALVPQPTSVAEGTSIMVAVMPLDEDEDAAAFAEKLTIALTPTGTADAADYTLVGAFTIEMGETASNRVELEVRADEDVGMESLMFDAVVSGDSKTGTETSTSTGVLSLYIDDETATKINTQEEADAYPKIRAALGKDPTNTVMNPGETGTIMTSDLFEVIPGYTASYGVSVDSESLSASASGDSITIAAKSATGEGVPAKVTVTGTARVASSSFAPSQTVSNVAELTFEVMVVDTTLSVTVSADPMEIAEGGTSMITATASREITAGDGAVEIDLTVVGDGELDADSITIAMGAMSGSAMLTATEDDADFEDETVTVVATGSGIDGTMQVAVAVTDNDEAPAVPNQISAKPQDEAYPVITAAIAAGAGEDEMLTYGESVELMASDLFTVMDGYTASYRVSVEGTAVTGSADGDSISVMAASAGEAKVTITGTAKMAASSFDASQDATNVASITFPVTVEAEPEPVPEPEPEPEFQISAKPQDEAYPVITAAIAAGAGEDEMLTYGEAVELMASDLFTVMDGYAASYRVSVEGTAVTGSASGDSISVMAASAGEAKVTITGTAKMAASSFDASQDATNVASITFPVTVEAEPEPVVPEPVPALPLIAQWLLGLGLMGGGARQLFRRRSQSQG